MVYTTYLYECFTRIIESLILKAMQKSQGANLRRTNPKRANLKRQLTLNLSIKEWVILT